MTFIYVVLLVLCTLFLRIKYKLRQPPDFVIGDPADPYLCRWWILPRNNFHNQYIHHMRCDDDDRALHDHMYHNCSIVLRGTYGEVTHGRKTMRWFRKHKKEFAGLPQAQSSFGLPTIKLSREAGSIVFRRPGTPHRLTVEKGPVWTLFITGPRVRQWGFHTEAGWVHWADFCDPDNPGMTRKQKEAA